MQKAVGYPFNFLTSASRVMKDSFGLETRLLLVLQCCHDCKRRKLQGTKEKIPPEGLRAWWRLKSLLLSHTVSTLSSITDHGGSLGRDAGMLGWSKLHPNWQVPTVKSDATGRTTITLRSVLDISESKISYSCYRLPFIVNGSSTKVFRT